MEELSEKFLVYEYELTGRPRTVELKLLQSYPDGRTVQTGTRTEHRHTEHVGLMAAVERAVLLFDQDLGAELRYKPDPRAGDSSTHLLCDRRTFGFVVAAART